MDSIKELSPSKCILLASILAADADLHGLRTLTTSRPSLFDIELVLRILLSCLPEALDPSSYTPFIEDTITSQDRTVQGHSQLDISSVEQLSEAQARKRLKRVHLLPLEAPDDHVDLVQDPLASFLIHRSYRIDAETGLFPLIPKLLEPFLDHSDAVRDFYLGTILPLYRLDYEYYPLEGDRRTLQAFQDLEGYEGLQILLTKANRMTSGTEQSEGGHGQALRGIVAPWVYGHQRWAKSSHNRKRRRLDDSQVPVDDRKVLGAGHEIKESERQDDWQRANEWILETAHTSLPAAVDVIEAWDGPQDVDFGEHEELRQYYEFPEQERILLQRNYCQAAFAAIYAAESDESEAIDSAHSMLVRLAELLEFEPPPDLATSVELLPQIEHQAEPLELTNVDYIQKDALLRPDNPLTIPELETFSLLQMFVYSAYQLSALGLSLSVVKVAKLRFWSDESEQLRLLQRILDGLVKGPKRDQTQWMSHRQILLWLWDWAISDRSQTIDNGYGILGKIRREVFEKELLRALCTAGQFDLVTKVYLFSDYDPPLPSAAVEKIIVDLAMSYYDEASNGNRNRGGVKKAADLVTAFRSQFTNSLALQRCTSLFGATHALSFYSLTLQRGVPFKPVAIRMSEDPVGLLHTLLDQNPGSYTQLDNLIGIGRNLANAHIGDQSDLGSTQSPDAEDETQTVLKVERRVTSMAIEAALTEGDFETAYSYVVNRLSLNDTKSSASSAEPADDISWRAAYLAGRQRPSSAATTSAGGTSTSPQVRRLEQRMELLSQSLLLAPSTALPEVLNAWRKCEEELLTVLASETEAEVDFDDRADRQETHLPGAFGGIEQGFMVQPKRKELGRGAVEEAPMGLFDVARGAAAALSRTAGRQDARNAPVKPVPESEADATDAPGRTRKRDVLANAVTGGMVSSIGWVLGAKPPPVQDG